LGRRQLGQVKAAERPIVINAISRSLNSYPGDPSARRSLSAVVEKSADAE
jgi:hypothetical protein